MKKTLLIVIVCLVMVVLALLWWRYVPLTDGTYVVENDKIAWHLTISNGVFKTSFIENKITGEKLKIKKDSDEFVMRIGNANSIGWSEAHKKPTDKYPPYMVRDGIEVTPSTCKAAWLIRGFGSTTFLLKDPGIGCEIRIKFTPEKDVPWLKREIYLRAIPCSKIE